MISEKKVYSGIDICKLVAAILVVLLHTVETSAWIPCEIKYVFTRFAVPFFFITSGYFFYRGLRSAESPKRYFLRYIKNLLFILLVWQFVLYLPFTIKTYVLKYSGAGAIKIAMVLIRRLFIIGSGPYWYIVALLYASVFLYFCFIHRSGKKILITAIAVGFVLEITYSCFQGVLSKSVVFSNLFKIIYVIWSWEFNFVTFGIPFMGLGYIIALKDIQWKQSTSIAFFVLMTLLRIVEYNLPLLIKSTLWEQNSISLAFIVQAAAFFMIGKGTKHQLSKEKSMCLRQLSSTIYYTHAIFLYEILNPLMDKFTNLDTYSGAMIIPKMMIVLLLCCIFYVIVKKIDNKHLNVLING